MKEGRSDRITENDLALISSFFILHPSALIKVSIQVISLREGRRLISTFGLSLWHVSIQVISLREGRASF
ncbi:MAG: hypothetical protein AAGD25_04090 [Cyanobacteria bacterium P01_F01_bin.150]